MKLLHQPIYTNRAHRVDHENISKKKKKMMKKKKQLASYKTKYGNTWHNYRVAPLK